VVAGFVSRGVWPSGAARQRVVAARSEEAIFAVDVVNFATVEPIESASADTPATTWREMPEDVRRQIKIGYPARRVSPEQARAAVWWARQRRAVLDRGVIAAWTVVALLALWTIIGLAAPAARGGLAESSAITVATILGAVAIAAWFVCAVIRHAAIRVEAAYLADALPPPPSGASNQTVNWRHSRAFLGARAGAAAIVVGAIEVGIVWLAARHRHAADVLPIVLVQIAAWAYVAARWAYGWPWPIASSYPHLAALDGHELRVHPLGLTVPWHRVTRVRFGATATGVALPWYIDDPAAVVAEAPVSPADQRRLLRWLTANGGAVRLTESQMLESPETVYANAESIRNGRLSAFRLGVPSPAPEPSLGPPPTTR
jgi:hypothetical protein